MMMVRDSVVTRHVRKMVKISPDDVAKIESASREEQLGQVTMTSDGIRIAPHRKALPEADGNIQDALVARELTTFMGPGEERQARA